MGERGGGGQYEHVPLVQEVAIKRYFLSRRRFDVLYRRTE